MSQSNPCVFEWLSFEPEYDRLVEIFQGYRGSSEAPDAGWPPATAGPAPGSWSSS